MDEAEISQSRKDKEDKSREKLMYLACKVREITDYVKDKAVGL